MISLRRVRKLLIEPSVLGYVSCNHRPYIVHEPGNVDHQDVYGNKQQRESDKSKMKRASGLVTTQRDRHDWKHRSNPERHRQARPENGGKEREHDGQID